MSRPKFKIGDKVFYRDKVNIVVRKWKKNGAVWYELKSSSGCIYWTIEECLQTLEEYEAEVMRRYKTRLEWIRKDLSEIDKELNESEAPNSEKLDIDKFDEKAENLYSEINLVLKILNRFINEYKQIELTLKQEDCLNNIAGELK